MPSWGLGIRSGMCVGITHVFTFWVGPLRPDGPLLCFGPSLPLLARPCLGSELPMDLTDPYWGHSECFLTLPCHSSCYLCPPTGLGLLWVSRCWGILREVGEPW